MPVRNGRLRGFMRVAWFVPAALAGLVIAVLGGLLWLMHQRSFENDRADLISSRNTAREAIQKRLDASRDYLKMIAEDMARGGDTDPIRKRISQYLADHRELLSVYHVDAGATIRWVAPHEANRKIVGLRLTAPQVKAAFQSALTTGQPAYSRPFIALQGQASFEVHVPIFREKQFAGTVVGVYSCDRVVRHMFSLEIVRKHQISLIDAGGNVIVGLPTASKIDERLIECAPLDPPGWGTSLRLARYGAGFWAVGLTALTLLCAGLVVGMAWGMWSLNRQIARRGRAEASLRQARDELTQRVRERTADLEDANTKLQEEIVERQRAEQEARQHHAELAHVARVSTMGEMAAGLAHEINQPLAAIASFADGGLRIIEGGSPNVGELGMAMDEISEQAKRAGQIIHRLRAFVTRSEFQKTPADVRRLTTEVVDLLIMDIRHEQIDFRLDTGEDVGEVLVDRIQVQQVILNLMRNAIEAMEKTDPTQRHLVVRARRSADGMIEISVSDTGPGCGDETIEQIFDAFFTTKSSGIGMGLSISRSIVEAHGGRLWVTPNPGSGLTFRFTLPSVDGDSDERREQS